MPHTCHSVTRYRAWSGHFGLHPLGHRISELVLTIIGGVRRVARDGASATLASDLARQRPGTYQEDGPTSTRSLLSAREWYNDGMELVARPAREGLPGYWVRSMADVLLGVGPGRGKSEAYAPAVVVVSSSGEEWVLQRPGTYRQAQAACRRFEAERQSIGDAAFCQAYGVPSRLAE